MPACLPSTTAGCPGEPWGPARSAGLLTLYQEKVAEDVGGEHLLEPVGGDPVVLDQQPLRRAEHVDHPSEMAGDSCMTFMSFSN